MRLNEFGKYNTWRVNRLPLLGKHAPALPPNAIQGATGHRKQTQCGSVTAVRHFQRSRGEATSGIKYMMNTT